MYASSAPGKYCEPARQIKQSSRTSLVFPELVLCEFLCCRQRIRSLSMEEVGGNCLFVRITIWVYA
jgi:hypothetical protein